MCDDNDGAVQLRMALMMMVVMEVKLMRIDRGSSPDGVFPLHAFTISPPVTHTEGHATTSV